MFEFDFLPVGQAGRHGDAIAIRFTRPDTDGYAHVIIDAGFEANGADLVDHVGTWFETRSIDMAVVTHPDGDHIGGMGTVIRELDVGTLCIHRLGARGGRGLPAADAVDDLISVAERRGTHVHEPFAGDNAFGGALTFLGPDEHWYGELVAEQVAEADKRIRRGRGGVVEAARGLAARFVAALPVEMSFGDAGGTNPRNNSSAIALLEVENYRMLFTSDAGVPALDRGWDWLGINGRDTSPPGFVQLPHHGSRHNASSALLNRLLGPIGQDQTKTAYVNVAPEAKKHPAPRVANGFMRRGYRVFETRGGIKHHYSRDAPDRGWPAAVPLDPMVEPLEED